MSGDRYKEQLAEFVKHGFETFSVNWHMELHGADLRTVARECREITDNSGKMITTLGYYCNPLPHKAYKERIFHVHGKDSNVDKETVSRYGIISGEKIVYDRTLGFGDTDWRRVFFELYSIGYENDICIEGYHDPIYNGEWELTG